MKPSKNILRLLEGLEGNLEQELQNLDPRTKPDAPRIYDGISIAQPKKGRRTLREALAKFWSQVIASDDGCWNWKGQISRSGYGHFDFPILGKKPMSVLAHRMSFVLFNVRDPGSLLICHSCDNRSCVNPKHLFLGTAQDNSDDCVNKGRLPIPLRGSKNSVAKITDADVQEIRISKIPATKICKKFGVSPSTIRAARNGQNWSHLPWPLSK